jgi:hypothetical protein
MTTGGNTAAGLDRRPRWAGGFAVLLVAAVTIAALVVWPGADRGDAARPGPSPSPTPTPTSTTPVVVSPPSSIPSDCSVSVTSQLSNWVGTVPDYSTINFSASACYRIDETFTIRERTGLTFEGNGATFKTVTPGLEFPKPRSRSHWRLLHATDLAIKNLTVVGPNTAGSEVPHLEAQHGFEVDGGVRVTISGVTVKEVYGDGVGVARGFGTKEAPLPPRESEDILVVNSAFERVGRQGLSVTSARRVTFRGNTLSGVQRSVVDLEPNGPGNVIEDIVIDSNIASGYDLYLVAGGGVCATTYRNISIIGNTATGSGPRVGKLACLHRENLLVEGNTITVPASDGNQGILVVKFSGVVVRSNVVTLNQAVPGVIFQSSVGVLLIEDNDFCGAGSVYVADAQTGPVTESGNVLDC